VTTSARPRVRPVIRVFVSSTFNDLKQERNALQGVVFPNIERLCARSGFDFQAIDLRWGVSGEAALDHRTMRICLDELRRAQELSPKPNFLVLLGNRYGWRPLPEEISVGEFGLLEAAAAGVSTTGRKSAVGILREWYLQDENALPPVYLLQSRRQHLPDGVDYTANASWAIVQSVLWSIINRGMPAARLDHRFEEGPGPERSLPAVVRFQASATEQEIWHGALQVADAAEHVLAFHRELTNRDEFSPEKVRDFFDLTDGGRFDDGAAARQTALKEAVARRLGPENTCRIPFSRLIRRDGTMMVDASQEDLRQFCEVVERRLRAIIEPQFVESWRQTEPTSEARGLRDLELEMQDHARVGKERGNVETFVGRDHEMEAIRTYISNLDALPRVVHGPSGCGKTALLARSAQATSGLRPIVRFIGVTPRCSDLRGLLSSLCQELRLRHPRDGDLPTDIDALREELRASFGAATTEEPLVLFLDALDQLSDADQARQLHWLPAGPLPEHVKLVVSCLSDRTEDSAGEPFLELRQRQLPDRCFISLSALSREEASTLFFRRWLPRVHRTVTQSQRHRIEERLASSDCRQPIYLKLLFEEARLWQSYDEPPVGEDLSKLLEQYVARLSRPTNHGALLVDRVLGYLSASRDGLSEHEILRLLFADAEYRTALERQTAETRHEMPPGATTIPHAIWSRLRFDLAPYLTDRSAAETTVLTFYHRQVAEWVKVRVARDLGGQWNPHARLADFFRRLADPDGDRTWRGESGRPFLQLAHHLAGSPNVDELYLTMCDLRFIEVRCRLGQVFSIQSDYELARRVVPETRASVDEARQRRARAERWSVEIVDYARQWSERRDRLAACEAAVGEEPALPEPPPLCDFQPDEEVHSPGDEVGTSSAKSEQLEAFAGFVRGQSHVLHEHRGHPGFVLQHAYNAGPSGPVHDLAAQCLSRLAEPVLLRRWTSEDRRSPKPALLRALTEPAGEVHSVAVTPDARVAVSASGQGFGNGVIRVWDLASGSWVRVLHGHTGVVRSVAITPDGRLAVSGGGDGRTCVWNLITGECLRTLEAGRPQIWSVSVTPDGRWAISGIGYEGPGALVWDLQSGECVRSLRIEKGGILAVALSADGRIAVCAGDEGVLAWELTGTQSVHQLTDGFVGSLSLSADARRLVLCRVDGSLELWDLAERRRVRRYAEDGSPAVSVCTTPDGRLAVAGYQDGMVQVWDLDTGLCIRRLAGHTCPVNGVHVTPDGGIAVSGSGKWVGADSTVRVWDLTKGGGLREADGRPKPEFENWTPGGAPKFTTGYSSTTAVLHDWGRQNPDGHRGPVYALCVTPDARLGFTGGWDNVLRMWDMSSGRCIRTLPGHSGGVTNIVATPDSRWIVSGSFDHSIRVWDVKTGETVQTLHGHGNWITSLCLTPDGRRLVSGSRDRTVRVWDLPSGRCLAVFAASKPIRTVSVNDGGRLLSAETATSEVLALELDDRGSMFDGLKQRGMMLPCDESVLGTLRDKSSDVDVSHHLNDVRGKPELQEASLIGTQGTESANFSGTVANHAPWHPPHRGQAPQVLNQEPRNREQESVVDAPGLPAPSLRDRLREIAEALQSSHLDRCEELLRSSVGIGHRRRRDSRLKNALAVVRLRQGRISDATAILRGILFPTDGVVMDATAPDIYVINFAIAAALSGNEAAVESALDRLTDSQHPTVAALKAALDRRKASRPWWKRLVSGADRTPLALDVPLGEIYLGRAD
jgi:WD40 repeat protein